MKRHLFYSAAMALTLLLTACSGDDNNPTVDSVTDPDTNNPNPTPTYALGNTGPGGGIIFYLGTDGHGYEVGASLGLAKWDDAANLDNVENVTGLGTEMGTGQANTDLIVAAIGDGTYAAKMCADYEQGGKDDWFLPSKVELQTIYNYFRNCGCMGLSPSNNYWASSQGDHYTRAWNTDFSVNSATTEVNNWTFEVQKDQTLYVRPIRKF
ncbi:DUF1566 domain-containing protein [Flavobacterium zepuense]|uniref:DUF1566 domain-containing protein n=1 Tax=Flavobacterium zepuense TaxID=2593302 RepID=A0A552UTB5_9FLAO|nr:DUF1566 domain-containing protein [Flavobacterium zepuense]TRW21466.1 DUF1566 domain-containing protein [Flavobacterium zepuense]